MFDSHYPYNHIHTKGVQFEDYQIEHLYAFRGKGKHRYIIRVEQYDYFLYAVKFHLKSHTHSPEKYNVLTGFHDMKGCVGTCLKVMLEIYKNNPYASFCFIGANSKEENKEQTRRFLIYQRVMKNYFSDVHFFHTTVEKESFYMMLNRLNDKDFAAIFKIVKKLFNH